MVKVAILFSGIPRNVEKTIPILISNLITPNNADVFFHTWFKKDMENIGYDKERNLNVHIKNNVVEYLIDRLKPRAYLVEEPRLFKNSNIRIPKFFIDDSIKKNKHTEEEAVEHMVNNVYSMFYSIFQANKIKEDYCRITDTSYDVVIRCRFDVIIKNSLTILDISPNMLYYNNYPYWGDDVISDWFGCGTTAVMNAYASVYLFIEFLNLRSNVPGRETTAQYTDPTHIWGAEYLLRDMIRFFKINMQPKKFNIVHVHWYKNVHVPGIEKPVEMSMLDGVNA